MASRSSPICSMSPMTSFSNASIPTATHVLQPCLPDKTKLCYQLRASSDHMTLISKTRDFLTILTLLYGFVQIFFINLSLITPVCRPKYIQARSYGILGVLKNPNVQKFTNLVAVMHSLLLLSLIVQRKHLWFVD